MPTWKLKTENELLFYHLCSGCNENSAEALIKAGWSKIRDGEPVSCNECTRKCALTSKGLWGDEDEIRYEECKICPDYEVCPLKGRYYC
ncbi:MAG: hypothetical protein KQH63_11795 [Desulfobulbaceae bacterium]|nr:hypothetical protein [Desulfobulbaceae bacterium]